MARMSRFAVDDRITLKNGFVRSEQASKPGRILAVLPADGGRPQYRVRFEGENFDRRILEGDIDLIQSATPTTRVDGVADIQSGSWLKTSNLKVRK